jgi:hypothetical protein
VTVSKELTPEREAEIREQLLLAQGKDLYTIGLAVVTNNILDENVRLRAELERLREQVEDAPSDDLDEDCDEDPPPKYVETWTPEEEIRALLEMIGPAGGTVHADYARFLLAEVDRLRSEGPPKGPDTFRITDAQRDRIRTWLKEREEVVFKCEDAYYGTSGGGVTFCFTPTGLGIGLSVVHLKGTNLESSLDVTDYDNW